MSKKIKALMIGSLLLNVLLIGVIIGDMSHRLRREDPFGRHAREFALRLPEDKVALFLETVEKVHLDNREIHQKIRKGRRKAMKILAGPRFDEAAYQIQVEKLHELRGLMRRRLADATIELARQFDQEERRALAQYLKRPPRPPRDIDSPGDSRRPRHKVP
jgi:uncharacterized membrane protein